MIELSVIILLSIIVLWYAMPVILMICMVVLLGAVFILIEALELCVKWHGKK